MPRRTLSLIALAAAGALVVTGCTSGKPKATPTRTPTSTSTPSATATTAPTGDGVLRLGTLFPMTGAAAASGAAQVAGTELAAREIATQGHVLGKPMQILHRNSAGDVKAALANLVARGVDAVLWDATTPVPADVAAFAEKSGLAVLALTDFVPAGATFAPDKAFLARLVTADPGLTSGAGGAEAYDGVIVTALAATSSKDDGSAALQAGWASVRGGPTACVSWGECRAALADLQQIDYQGVTGAQS